MEIETDLRLVSDRMLHTLEQLEALENEKRTVAPGSQRFKRLAVEVERLAAALFAHTHAQQQLAERSQTVAEAAGSKLPPIAEVEQARELHVVLAEWREAERRLAATAQGTAEHGQAAADVRQLRDEYHRAYSAQAESSASRGD